MLRLSAADQRHRPDTQMEIAQMECGLMITQWNDGKLYWNASEVPSSEYLDEGNRQTFPRGDVQMHITLALNWGFLTPPLPLVNNLLA